MDSVTVAGVLSRVRPHRVVVRGEGDTADTEIALRKGRTRWQHAAEQIIRLDASRVELFDGNAALLEVIREDASSSSAQLAPGPSRAGVSAEVERLLALMLKAQEVALDRQNASMRMVLEQQTE